ncbi:MAG: NEW3 domain-containing protein, partial [Euryarchaeota archaeon]
LYAVKLTTDETDVEFDGSDSVVWEVEVENTGEQQANVQLEMNSDNDCESDDLSAEVDPAIVQLDSGDTETVEVTVEVPDGSSTEAGQHCFLLLATVTNDPNAVDRAEDNLSLRLSVPEVKECDGSLQTSSHNLDPGQTATNSFEVENIGNTEWTVQTQAQSPGTDISGWVEFDSPRSALLAKPGNSDDSHTFTFSVTPDDSVEAGSQIEIKIQGRSNQGIGCEQTLTVTIGQVHEARLTLSTSKLSNVEPGTSDSVTITVENRGNGLDTYSLTTMDLPEGWQISFSQSSVTVNSKHNSNNEASLTATVNVPSNALAGDNTVEFGVTVSGSTTILNSRVLTVSVAARHDLTADILSTQQTGRSGQVVQFPIDISNTGNTRDTFKLQVCDPNDQTGCNPPMWAASYSDNSGNSITQIILDPGESKRVFLDVTVEGEEDADSVTILSRVAIFGTSEKVEQTISVIVSNYDYGMAITPEMPGSIAGQMDIVLPPGGSKEINFWVENTGNFPGG